MIVTTLTVIPAYGRDYMSAAAVKAAWSAGKDFTIQGLGGHGRAINKQDADHPDYGIKSVRVRYASTTKVVTVK